MIKNLSILFLTIAFFTAAIAQDRNLTSDRKIVPDPNNKIVVNESGTQQTSPLTPGEAFITTGYDYMTNNVSPNMIDLVDIDADGSLDPIMTAMKRETPTGTRFVMFGYKAFGVIDAFNAFDDAIGTVGWGNVHYCVGGPLDGFALVMGHNGGTIRHSVIDLVNLAPVLPYPATTFGGNFPQFAYQTDGDIWAATTDHNIYYSSDQGSTFSVFAAVGDGDANVTSPVASANTPSEIPIISGNGGEYLATFGGWDGIAVAGNPDVVYWYGSLDGGATWNGLIIGRGSGTNPEYGQVANREYAPYFTNFSQMSGVMGDDGTTHIVVNGYGEGVVPGATDTTNINGMAYWNSNDQQWLYLSIPATEAWDDGFGNVISGGTVAPRIYPGNGIGQAYGTVSVNTQGNVVVAAWQCMEYTGTIGASAYNMYPGDGGTETGPIYYTDLHWTYSTDGGQTWATPSILKGDPSVMETYPYMAPRLEADATTNTYVAHYVYYDDAIPGAAIFNGQVAGQNSWDANGTWRYERFDTGIPVTTSVEGEVVVNSFNLEQNYPNPFNPSTKIKYSVAERSNVSIKVYDVLGNQVANLVNDVKEAGAYEVSFNASNLASGIYVYTITAGNFTSSKKMMLMK